MAVINPENHRVECECGNDHFVPVSQFDAVLTAPTQAYTYEAKLWCIACSAMHVFFRSGEKVGTWERREFSATARGYRPVPA